MTPGNGVAVRFAHQADASFIAQLHADSWRRNYRGAYSDRYLDGDLDAERLAVWTDRLHRPTPGALTLIAVQGEHNVGFLHAELDADPQWGALIDNLHVTHDLRGAGVGTALLRAAAATVAQRRPGSAIYLWVQQQNDAAQRFYLARGGAIGDRAPVSPPGGDPRNLDGTPSKLRVTWADPARITAG